MEKYTESEKNFNSDIDISKLATIYSKLSLDDLRHKLEVYEKHKSEHTKTEESESAIDTHVRLLKEAIASKEN